MLEAFALLSMIATAAVVLRDVRSLLAQEDIADKIPPPKEGVLSCMSIWFSVDSAAQYTVLSCSSGTFAPRAIG
jgi:hypothetical protein